MAAAASGGERKRWEDALPRGQRTRALCIGANDYTKMDRLANAIADADGIAQCIDDLPDSSAYAVQNPNRRLLKKAIEDFLVAIPRERPPRIVLIFYAGHAIQDGDKIFLVPVNADPKTPEDLKNMCLSHDDLFRMLKVYVDDEIEVENVLFVVILDACRKALGGGNVQTQFSREIHEPLPEKRPNNWVLCTSTSRGAAAADGEGGHSLFTEALMSAECGMFQQDVPLNWALKMVCQKLRGQEPCFMPPGNIPDSLCLHVSDQRRADDEYFDVFLCYRDEGEDRALAERLRDKLTSTYAEQRGLEKRPLRVFLEAGPPPPDRIVQIADAMHNSAVILLLISHSTFDGVNTLSDARGSPLHQMLWQYEVALELLECGTHHSKHRRFVPLLIGRRGTQPGRPKFEDIDEVADHGEFWPISKMPDVQVKSIKEDALFALRCDTQVAKGLEDKMMRCARDTPSILRGRSIRQTVSAFSLRDIFKVWTLQGREDHALGDICRQLKDVVDELYRQSNKRALEGGRSGAGAASNISKVDRHGESESGDGGSKAAEKRPHDAGKDSSSHAKKPRQDSVSASIDSDCNELVRFLKAKGLSAIALQFSEALGIENIENLAAVIKEDLDDPCCSFLKPVQKRILLQLAAAIIAHAPSLHDDQLSSAETGSQGSSTTSEGESGDESGEDEHLFSAVLAKHPGTPEEFQMHITGFLSDVLNYMSGSAPETTTEIFHIPSEGHSHELSCCMLVWMRFAKEACPEDFLRDKWLDCIKAARQDDLLKMLETCLKQGSTCHKCWKQADFKRLGCTKQFAAAIFVTDEMVRHSLRGHAESARKWQQDVVRDWFQNGEEASAFLFRANYFLRQHMLNGTSVVNQVVETQSYVAFMRMTRMASLLLFEYLNARKFQEASAPGAAGSSSSLFQGFRMFVSSSNSVFSLTEADVPARRLLPTVLRGLRCLSRLSPTAWGMMGEVKTANDICRAQATFLGPKMDHQEGGKGKASMWPAQRIGDDETSAHATRPLNSQAESQRESGPSSRQTGSQHVSGRTSRHEPRTRPPMNPQKTDKAADETLKAGIRTLEKVRESVYTNRVTEIFYRDSATRASIQRYLQRIGQQDTAQKDRLSVGSYIDSASGEVRLVDGGSVALELLANRSFLDECNKCEEAVIKDLRCPISGGLLQNPVTCSDGHTYERAVIVQRFRQAEMEFEDQKSSVGARKIFEFMSPKTKQPLDFKLEEVSDRRELKFNEEIGEEIRAQNEAICDKIRQFIEAKSNALISMKPRARKKRILHSRHGYDSQAGDSNEMAGTVFDSAKRFFDWIVARSRAGLACLTGPPASGKTVTMQQIVYSAVQDCSAKMETDGAMPLLPLFMRAAVLSQLISKCDRLALSGTDREPEQLLREVVTEFLNHGIDLEEDAKTVILDLYDYGRLFICIDGLDEAATHQELLEVCIEHAVKSAQQQSQQRLHVLLSTREHSYIRSCACLRLGAFDVVNLQPLNEARQKQMICGRIPRERVDAFGLQLAVVAGKNQKLATSPFLMNLMIELYLRFGEISGVLVTKLENALRKAESSVAGTLDAYQVAATVLEDVMDASNAAGVLSKMDTSAAAKICCSLSLKSSEVCTSLAGVLDVMDAWKAAGALGEMDTSAAAKLLDEMHTISVAGVLDVMAARKAAGVLAEMSASSAARILYERDPDSAAELLVEMSAFAAAGVLGEMHDSVAAQIVTWMDRMDTSTSGAEVLDEMDVYKVAALLCEIDTSATAGLLSKMDTKNATEVLGEMMDADKVAKILDEMHTSAAAGLLSEMGVSIAAGVLGEMNTSVPNLMEEMNTTAAAGVLNEMDISIASGVLVVMNTSAAAGVLSEMDVSIAAGVLVVMDTTAAAGVLNEMDISIASGVLVVMHTSAAAGLLSEMDVSIAAGVLEEMNTSVAKLMVDAYKVAKILGEMHTSAAAGLLSEMDISIAAGVLEEMNTLATSAARAAASAPPVELPTHGHSDAPPAGGPTRVASSLRAALRDASVANLMEEMDTTAAAGVLNEMDISIASGVLDVMNTSAAAGLLNEIEDISNVAKVLGEVRASKAAGVLEEMKDTVTAAGVLGQMNTSAAVAVLYQMDTGAAARVLGEVRASKAAGVLGKMKDIVTVAGVLDQMNTSAAAAVLDQMYTRAAARVLGEMDGSQAAGVLGAMCASKAAGVLNEMEDTSDGSDGNEDIMDRSLLPPISRS